MNKDHKAEENTEEGNRFQMHFEDFWGRNWIALQKSRELENKVVATTSAELGLLNDRALGRAEE